jgi:drug/metabolite transporter (DMT)-like permease
MGYILLEKYKSKYAGKELCMAFIQMLTVLIGSMFVSIFHHNFVLDWDIIAQPNNFVTLLYTGCITSAFAIALETKISSFVDAEDTALILTTEPIWALITSMIFLHETITIIDIVGSCFIFLSCLYSNKSSFARYRSK